MRLLTHYLLFVTRLAVETIFHAHFGTKPLFMLAVQMALVHRPVRGVCFVGHDCCKLQLYALHNCV